MAPEAYRLGLLGWPLEHSLSPELHRAALQASGLIGTYSLYPVEPGTAAERNIRALLARVRSGELQGLNVTLPYKQTVIPWLDRLSPTAGAAGAVNMIYLDGVRLAGDNTDIPGFLAGLEALPLNSRESALVLGAGGAARAVVCGLASTWKRIYLAARRVSQAQGVAAGFKGVVPQGAAGPRIVEILPLPFTTAALREAAHSCDLIVNTTPVGMAPAVDYSPWPSELPIPPGAAVYDLVYNPVETLLVRTARLAGAPGAGGLDMLIEQAALSFERWTGRSASREAMRSGLPF